MITFKVKKEAEQNKVQHLRYDIFSDNNCRKNQKRIFKSRANSSRLLRITVQFVSQINIKCQFAKWNTWPIPGTKTSAILKNGPKK
jgi:hypothetical protein